MFFSAISMAKIKKYIYGDITYNYIEILQIHQRFPAFVACIIDTIRLLCVTFILHLLKLSAAMDYGDIQRRKTYQEFWKPQKKTLMVIFFLSKLHQD